MTARVVFWVMAAVVCVVSVHLLYGQASEDAVRRAPCGIGWLYSSRTPCDD
jgi:hypothetical protein